jgi:ABC-type transport system substrate-binding protein
VARANLRFKAISVSALILISGYFGVQQMKRNSVPKTLKIAFASPWKNIHPGLQHTLIGDLTLSNQFEALVGFNDDGVYVPLAATEWTISPDFKIFTFKIDTSKKFSDGVKLSAKHFKESWERALRLEPKSSNSSLLDVLYKLEGFAEFEKTGSLSGIVANDDDTLQLRFSTSFRMALEHLSGNRFSAYREEGSKFLGTGAYVIDEIGPDLLKLTGNPFYPTPARDSIELSVVTSKDSVSALREGKIEVMAYAMGGAVSDDLSTSTNLSTIVGQDALHRAIYPNAQKGHLFEKKEFRQALQYLITKYLEENPSALGNPKFTTVDAQAYLPLQAGRIDESVVSGAVANGEKFVPELLKAANENPPVLIETDEFSLKPILAAVGIPVSKKSRIVSKSDFISIIYSGEEADLMPGSFGVASGDPDGLYHLLGRNGAITSPMLKNENVAQMLEDGRKLIDRGAIDPFYQKVSLAILDQAPIVHMGFNKAVAIYRNDLIKVSGHILRRNEGHLHIFEER